MYRFVAAVLWNFPALVSGRSGNSSSSFPGFSSSCRASSMRRIRTWASWLLMLEPPLSPGAGHRTFPSAIRWKSRRSHIPYEAAFSRYTRCTAPGPVLYNLESFRLQFGEYFFRCCHFIFPLNPLSSTTRSCLTWYPRSLQNRLEVGEFGAVRAPQ